MAKNSRRRQEQLNDIDRESYYPLKEAVKLTKEKATAKFDETIELAVNLNVDPRHADQMVRGVVSLPHGTGKSVRVAVFAKGENRNGWWLVEKPQFPEDSNEFNTIIAYEPIWAIGSGLTPNIDEIENSHRYIKNLSKKLLNFKIESHKTI